MMAFLRSFYGREAMKLDGLTKDKAVAAAGDLRPLTAVIVAMTAVVLCINAW